MRAYNIVWNSEFDDVLPKEVQIPYSVEKYNIEDYLWREAGHRPTSYQTDYKSYNDEIQAILKKHPKYIFKFEVDNFKCILKSTDKFKIDFEKEYFMIEKYDGHELVFYSLDDYERKEMVFTVKLL